MTTTSTTNAIIRTGLIAGTLDILAAITVYAIILEKATAVQILQGIASGIFGNQAYAGGAAMALTGIFLHYLITMAFTAAYFLVYPHLSLLHKRPVINGVLYGALVWCVMNLAVLPLSNYRMGPYRLWPVLLGMIILILMIGLPVAICAQRHFTRKITAVT
jgi:uncharacterized membrane protein YagU involved in acid resistance